MYDQESDWNPIQPSLALGSTFLAKEKHHFLTSSFLISFSQNVPRVDLTTFETF